MRDTTSILPLTVESLVFEVDGRRLIDGIDLHLERGATTVLLGPNGAGKSLLLRLCHGLLTPTAGRVRWALPEGRAAGVKRHTMVFQKPVMLRRSVFANLTHALAAAGLGYEARRARARAALERFRLADLADRPARVLSGGEQQRLAIARAWALDADVLFLDEPTSQLDPSATRAIEEMLRALKDEGRTLMMATHDLGQARRLADRVLFVHAGRIREDASAAAFFTAPATGKARAFLAGDLLD
ncbi:ATP-binding cassette domain-containing protein [Pinisolibacter aquiterrae]|uniref:ATP-binding cassette domain-containing protein n=1 Tax=Pinisolibacter aquiterrae TaxID=2815579 RepID=UPI001C3C4E17|nr:ATP-binding cassette domain-containing protein [Pinisolibacter aquiterrae]MBV5262740.1 ATP-binding cassette domain-containing protein [Pinisolibacter aquiterrae]MCC8233560.1 ATP-binding cassette domain-containing protein [Pinisolibacter aquiterrae]